MGDKEKFTDELMVLYKKRDELDVLEKARGDAHSAAGQAIASKQAEVTLAEKAVKNAAK